MTDGEREGLRAAEALLQHGFADYAEHLLRCSCGRAGAAPLGLLRNAGPIRAIAAIREALNEDA